MFYNANEYKTIFHGKQGLKTLATLQKRSRYIVVIYKLVLESLKSLQLTVIIVFLNFFDVEYSTGDNVTLHVVCSI